MKRKSPYPGLRPFAEEEAIFFRGREDHVYQIIKSLEEKRFVMITGASGDGKSSIVYAGLVPKAKAGFFKSRFNNWKVCDFRPEKSPFENMCKQVSESLKLDFEYVKKELSFGFSSLIKLYKESELFFEENDADFQGLSAEERVLKKRSGANLLLIVDQFEEFFTNSENLVNGNPNDKSHLVANLLSNTIRLAKELDLPIYVVFTMRSDYIGNCASLRGIPELIGYSQYFIPRLNREEIADVIRDPADLNGDAIQNRLVDHLINSTTEGSDQLPIIQHCMNRIWRTADGSDLDLYHLAMCQGLKVTDLPKEQQNIPELKGISDQKSEKTLNNVINAHATDLFDLSIKNYLKKYPESKKEEVKENLVFLMKSMAKMDNGKGVRYKCVFGELVSNLKYPMNLEQVNSLVFLFRKEGNDLLAPYSNQIPVLAENDPIEISHESLIRNWVPLKDWAIHDTQDYQTFQDLRAQSDKWEENDRSKYYLLGIGPLDYFEKWFERTDPSVFWIMKYEQHSVNDTNIRESISEMLERIKEFITESRKAINAARVARRRRRTALLIAASLAVLILTSITIWAFREKSLADDAKVIAETQKKNAELATQEAIKSEEKALYLSALSDSSLRVSEENEKLANQAKIEALQQKALAESSKQFALEQAKIAKDEANKTLQAIDQLLEQKNLTETQRDSANIARNEAYELSMKAVSTSLALQASRFEIEPELSGLMAYHAYNFNKNVNGNDKDPSLYSGTTAALSKLKGPEYNLLSESSYMANDILIRDKDHKIFAVNNEGFVDIWDFRNGFFLGLNHAGIMQLETNFDGLAADAFFLDDNSMAFVDLKGNLAYFNAFNTNLPDKEYQNHSKLINQVKKSDSKIISASIDGEIIIQPIKDEGPILKYECSESVLDLAVSNQKIVFITKSKCGLVDLKTGLLIKDVEVSGGLRACLFDASRIILTTNQGSVIELNENLELKNTLQFGYVPISQIKISNDKKTLAVASADKRIGIFNLMKLNEDPMIIENVGSQIRSLGFSDDGFVLAGLEDGNTMFWSIDISQNIDEICNNLSRSFTTDEWEKYIGNKIEYTEACKK